MSKISIKKLEKGTYTNVNEAKAYIHYIEQYRYYCLNTAKVLIRKANADKANANEYTANAAKYNEVATQYMPKAVANKYAANKAEAFDISANENLEYAAEFKASAKIAYKHLLKARKYIQKTI